MHKQLRKIATITQWLNSSNHFKKLHLIFWLIPLHQTSISIISIICEYSKFICQKHTVKISRFTNFQNSLKNQEQHQSSLGTLRRGRSYTNESSSGVCRKHERQHSSQHWERKVLRAQTTICLQQQHNGWRKLRYKYISISNIQRCTQKIKTNIYINTERQKIT